jgi:hypothetical protein
VCVSLVESGKDLGQKFLNTLCLLGLCAFPAPSVEYSGFSIGFEKDTKERRVPPCENTLSSLFFLLRGCLFLEATSKSVWVVFSF